MSVARIIPRRAFNNQVDLAKAYTWDRKDLFGFLHQVAKTPTNFGIREEVESDVVRCVNLITEFKYGHATLLRQLKQASHLHQGRTKNKPIRDEKTFLWKGVKTPFFSVYDCLAYVFSSMGTAEPGASREDYFAPLVSVFSKNLLNLAGDLAMAPNRAFIAFNDLPFEKKPVMLSFDVPQAFASPPTDLDVALGANIGGAGELKSLIQEARWFWMKEEGILDLGPSPDVSVIRKTLGTQGQLFGHCAETIPLIVHLGTKDQWAAKSVGGICINIRSLGKVANYDSEAVHKCLVDPCPNCREVMKQYQADPERFKKEMVAILKAIKH
ncbi:MAG: hypothetical protein Q9163_001424 [Psora crenata]